MLRSMLFLQGKAIYRDTFSRLRAFVVNSKLQRQNDIYNSEKNTILQLKSNIKDLKLQIRDKENSKRRMKKKFEKSLLRKVFRRMDLAIEAKKLLGFRLLFRHNKKTQNYKLLILSLVSITNSKLQYCFNKFQGASLIEKEKFLLEELRQIKEDQQELIIEREQLNEQLVEFVKEKELVEVTLPREVHRLKIIKQKVEREAAVDEIFLKNKRSYLRFFMDEWVTKFRRKTILRKLLIGERQIDLEGYFNSWRVNAKQLSSKLNSIEKWRKFVLRKEKTLKAQSLAKLGDFIMIREKEILEEKIE